MLGVVVLGIRWVVRTCLKWKRENFCLGFEGGILDQPLGG